MLEGLSGLPPAELTTTTPLPAEVKVRPPLEGNENEEENEQPEVDPAIQISTPTSESANTAAVATVETAPEPKIDRLEPFRQGLKKLSENARQAKEKFGNALRKPKKTDPAQKPAAQTGQPAAEAVNATTAATTKSVKAEPTGITKEQAAARKQADEEQKKRDAELVKLPEGSRLQLMAKFAEAQKKYDQIKDQAEADGRTPDVHYKDGDYREDRTIPLNGMEPNIGAKYETLEHLKQSELLEQYAKQIEQQTEEQLVLKYGNGRLSGLRRRLGESGVGKWLSETYAGNVVKGVGKVTVGGLMTGVSLGSGGALAPFLFGKGMQSVTHGSVELMQYLTHGNSRREQMGRIRELQQNRSALLARLAEIRQATVDQSEEPKNYVDELCAISRESDRIAAELVQQNADLAKWQAAWSKGKRIAGAVVPTVVGLGVTGIPTGFTGHAGARLVDNTVRHNVIDANKLSHGVRLFGGWPPKDMLQFIYENNRPDDYRVLHKAIDLAARHQAVFHQHLNPGGPIAHALGALNVKLIAQTAGSYAAGIGLGYGRELMNGRYAENRAKEADRLWNANYAYEGHGYRPAPGETPPDVSPFTPPHPLETPPKPPLVTQPSPEPKSTAKPLEPIPVTMPDPVAPEPAPKSPEPISLPEREAISGFTLEDKLLRLTSDPTPLDDEYTAPKKNSKELRLKRLANEARESGLPDNQIVVGQTWEGAHPDLGKVDEHNKPIRYDPKKIRPKMRVIGISWPTNPENRDAYSIKLRMQKVDHEGEPFSEEEIPLFILLNQGRFLPEAEKHIAESTNDTSTAEVPPSESTNVHTTYSLQDRYDHHINAPDSRDGKEPRVISESISNEGRTVLPKLEFGEDGENLALEAKGMFRLAKEYYDFPGVIEPGDRFHVEPGYGLLTKKRDGQTTAFSEVQVVRILQDESAAGGPLNPSTVRVVMRPVLGKGKNAGFGSGEIAYSLGTLMQGNIAHYLGNESRDRGAASSSGISESNESSGAEQNSSAENLIHPDKAAAVNGDSSAEQISDQATPTQPTEAEEANSVTATAPTGPEQPAEVEPGRYAVGQIYMLQNRQRLEIEDSYVNARGETIYAIRNLSQPNQPPSVLVRNQEMTNMMVGAQLVEPRVFKPSKSREITTEQMAHRVHQSELAEIRRVMEARNGGQTVTDEVVRVERERQLRQLAARQPVSREAPAVVERSEDRRAAEPHVGDVVAVSLRGEQADQQYLVTALYGDWEHPQAGEQIVLTPLEQAAETPYGDAKIIALETYRDADPRFLGNEEALVAENQELAQRKLLDSVFLYRINTLEQTEIRNWPFPREGDFWQVQGERAQILGFDVVNQGVRLSADRTGEYTYPLYLFGLQAEYLGGPDALPATTGTTTPTNPLEPEAIEQPTPPAGEPPEAEAESTAENPPSETEAPVPPEI